MQEQNNKYKIIAGVLVLVALGLGLSIYKQNTPQTDNSTKPTSSSLSVSKDAELTADEKKLFNPPATTAPAADKKAHYELALRMSTESDALEIKNCVATPVVIRVRLGSTFSVKNAGSSEIDFGFGEKVKIAPGASAPVKADFKNGVGVYGFGCSDTKAVSRLIGYVMVMPAK